MDKNTTLNWIEKHISEHDRQSYRVNDDGSLVISNILNNKFTNINEDLPFDIKDVFSGIFWIYKNSSIGIYTNISFDTCKFKNLPKLPNKFEYLSLHRTKVENIDSIFDSHIERIYYTDPSMTEKLEMYSKITGCILEYKEQREFTVKEKIKSIIGLLSLSCIVVPVFFMIFNQNVHLLLKILVSIIPIGFTILLICGMFHIWNQDYKEVYHS